ncbi:MAG: V-type ATPase subunit [archaeon]
MNLKYVSDIAGRMKGPPVNFEYAATRVRVSAGRLLTEADYHRFIKMDIKEIIRVLEEGEYKKDIDELSTKYSDADLVEKAINISFVKEMKRVVGFLPKGSALEEYLKRWDIFNIKTLLRSKESRNAQEILLDNLVPVGELSGALLDRLVKAETPDAVIEGLRGTTYYKVAAEHKGKTLREIEDALDKVYYERVLERGGGCKSLMKIVKAEIDLKNAVNLLRANGLGLENPKGIFIAGGNLRPAFFIGLLGAEKREITLALNKKGFGKHIPIDAAEPSEVESGLRRYYMLLGYKLLRDYEPSVNTMLGYIRAKEREVNNIRIILRSKKVENQEEQEGFISNLYWR